MDSISLLREQLRAAHVGGVGVAVIVVVMQQSYDPVQRNTRYEHNARPVMDQPVRNFNGIAVLFYLFLPYLKLTTP